MSGTIKGLALAAFAIGALAIFATDMLGALRWTAQAQSKPEAGGPSLAQLRLLTEARRGLPARMDELTVLDSFAFDGTTLVYGYQVAAGLSPDVDVAAFKAAGLPNSCRTLNDAYRPGELEAIRHHYVFSGGTVLDIDVSRLDCARAKAADTPATGSGNFITEIGKQVGVDFSR